MTEKEPVALPPLEQALLDAMQALDTQITREMQRTPAERDSQGVQKWEPFQKRIERLCAFILNSLGEGEAELDSLLVLAQSFSKALQLVVEDLGADGLGKVRTDYCIATFDRLSNDAHIGMQHLKTTDLVS